MSNKQACKDLPFASFGFTEKPVSLAMYGWDLLVPNIFDYIPPIFSFLEGHYIDRTTRCIVGTVNLPQAEWYWLIAWLIYSCWYSHIVQDKAKHITKCNTGRWQIFTATWQRLINIRAKWMHRLRMLLVFCFAFLWSNISNMVKCPLS